MESIAGEIADKVMSATGSGEDAVLVQGEFTCVYHIVSILKEKGIKVVAATTERENVEETDVTGATVKRVLFRFVRFREY